jgi:hypothetical protein
VHHAEYIVPNAFVIPDIRETGTMPKRKERGSGWELFLKHLVEDAPFSSPLLEGAKRHPARRWMDFPALTL